MVTNPSAGRSRTIRRDQPVQRKPNHCAALVARFGPGFSRLWFLQGTSSYCPNLPQSSTTLRFTSCTIHPSQPPSYFDALFPSHPWRTHPIFPKFDGARSNDFDSDELDRDHPSGSDKEGDQHSTHKQSTAAHSVHPSTCFSHHFTHHSNHPSGQDPDRKSRHPSPHRSPTPSRHTPSRSQTALDGDTTFIRQTQNGEPKEVAVNSF